MSVAVFVEKLGKLGRLPRSAINFLLLGFRLRQLFIVICCPCSFYYSMPNESNLRKDKLNKFQGLYCTAARYRNVSVSTRKISTNSRGLLGGGEREGGSFHFQGSSYGGFFRELHLFKE